jgi:hypothetical protein
MVILQGGAQQCCGCQRFLAEYPIVSFNRRARCCVVLANVGWPRGGSGIEPVSCAATRLPGTRYPFTCHVLHHA